MPPSLRAEGWTFEVVTKRWSVSNIRLFLQKCLSPRSLSCLVTNLFLWEVEELSFCALWLFTLWFIIFSFEVSIQCYKQSENFSLQIWAEHRISFCSREEGYNFNDAEVSFPSAHFTGLYTQTSSSVIDWKVAFLPVTRIQASIISRMFKSSS